jgi:hypothetical protein
MYPPLPPNEPRTAHFASEFGGLSSSDRFSAGRLVIDAGEADAAGLAPLRLTQDAYFKVNIPPGNRTLCVKMFASGSSGSIDCNGGTPFGVELTEPAGVTPPSQPATGRGTDAGPGAAQLIVMQAVTDVGNLCNTSTRRCTITTNNCTRDADCINDFNTSRPCDVTTGFPTPASAVYTTANFLARKGVVQVSRSGENFDCASWMTSDGPGMLVTGDVDFDDTAGGNVASITRLADR